MKDTITITTTFKTVSIDQFIEGRQEEFNLSGLTKEEFVSAFFDRRLLADLNQKGLTKIEEEVKEAQEEYVALAIADIK